MLQDVEETLMGKLVRMLQSDPALTKEDALRRLDRIADDSGLSVLKPRLKTSAQRLKRCGVLNPLWLEKEGLRPHVFLATGRPGFLEQIVRNVDQRRTGVSQYLLYGHWDALVVLHGTESEADILHENLRAGAYEDPSRFSAKRVLLAYRHPVEPLQGDVVVQPEAANAFVDDYDADGDRSARDRLAKSRILLGTTWVLEGQPTYPIMAFVGLSLRGRSHVEPKAVLAALRSQEILSDTLIHVYEIEQGWPFHYFLKLGCANMRELDEATNSVGFTSLGSTRFEGTTLVVANGTDQLPMFRRAEIGGLPLGPDLSSVIRAGERVFSRLPADRQESFNRLDAARQLSVVKSLTEMMERVEEGMWDAATKARFVSASETFARECANADDRPNLTGAVSEATAAVEGLVRQLLSGVARAGFGNDRSTIQKELKLPSAVIRNLSLGKSLQALRVAEGHIQLRPWRDLLEEPWLARIERFAGSRNAWVHDSVDVEGIQLIDEAHRTIVEALELASWLFGAIRRVGSVNKTEGSDAAVESEPVLSELPEARVGREFRVFVSHAVADKGIAERIALGLKAFGFRSWYSDWELQPGDSIIERIDSAVGRSDVLLVLLSQRSVNSVWVKRELGAALMAQLSGQEVMVIPVIIEDCNVPALLRDTFYVDLRQDFEAGLVQLFETLGRRRRELR